MLLELTDVKASYGRSQVLFGISLSVDRGEVVTMMGRNGMGKTTTIWAIMGLLPCTGQVDFRNTRINGLPSYRRARLGLGLVPEGRQIFPKLTVRENLLTVTRGDKLSRSSWSLETVYDLFPRLRERSQQMGKTLSGGEQQMLAIGRALMTNPALLILDEATEGLAPLIRQEIWDCLERLKQAQQSMLIVDKNINELFQFANRHYIVEKGRVAWSGSNEIAKGEPHHRRQVFRCVNSATNNHKAPPDCQRRPRMVGHRTGKGDLHQQCRR